MSISSKRSTGSRVEFKTNQSMMKKIAAQTEAFNVLVGEIDFLEYQFCAMVRLLNPIILDDLTEVNLPTRFIFIMLGPKGSMNVYRQIGRSASTLMSDEVKLLLTY